MKQYLQWTCLLVACVGILGVFFIVISASGDGGSHPPSKAQTARTLCKCINEGLKYAVENGVSFPSTDNKEVVRVLDRTDPGDFLNNNHIKRNEKGEILDLWGRPYVFYRRGEHVCVFSYGPQGSQ